MVFSNEDKILIKNLRQLLHCYPFSQTIQNQKLDKSTNSDYWETNCYTNL